MHYNLTRRTHHRVVTHPSIIFQKLGTSTKPNPCGLQKRSFNMPVMPKSVLCRRMRAHLSLHLGIESPHPSVPLELRMSRPLWSPGPLSTHPRSRPEDQKLRSVLGQSRDVESRLVLLQLCLVRTSFKFLRGHVVLYVPGIRFLTAPA